ncbi:MAG TPA: MIP/aquaporin family protein [Candidatus Acidoferrum sp.]|nr:MIP/aquaporin family protein [Candidatus Acidoferrum sp.]
MRLSLSRRTTAEFLGTAFLVMAVVGSGIMAERLAGGNVALALLANTIATGAALVALILAFIPISGAHFNPAVTLMDALQCGLPWKETPHYMVAQISGGISGALIAHLMFGLPLIAYSRHVRSGPAQVFGEFVATFGLLAIIFGCTRLRAHGSAPPVAGAPVVPFQKPNPSVVAFAVGAYITAAYWFTSSTSFANPAVTIARCFTDTFAGIRPVDTLPFILAQFLGALAATTLFRWFFAQSTRGRELNPRSMWT